MSSRLVVLGSCGAWPEPGRACSGFMLEYADTRLVLDLGYATLPRLLSLLGTSVADGIDAVIVTHKHPDHMLDLHGLFRARWFGRREAPAIPLYAPEGVLARVAGLEEDDAAAVLRVFDWHPLPAAPAPSEVHAGPTHGPPTRRPTCAAGRGHNRQVVRRLPSDDRTQTWQDSLSRCDLAAPPRSGGRRSPGRGEGLHRCRWDAHDGGLPSHRGGCSTGKGRCPSRRVGQTSRGANRRQDQPCGVVPARRRRQHMDRDTPKSIGPLPDPGGLIERVRGSCRPGRG
jgi:hypothetical protein